MFKILTHLDSRTSSSLLADIGMEKVGRMIRSNFNIFTEGK